MANKENFYAVNLTQEHLRFMSGRVKKIAKDHNASQQSLLMQSLQDAYLQGSSDAASVLSVRKQFDFLFVFYDCETVPELIGALDKHVQRLQQSLAEYRERFAHGSSNPY